MNIKCIRSMEYVKKNSWAEKISFRLSIYLFIFFCKTFKKKQERKKKVSLKSEDKKKKYFL